MALPVCLPERFALSARVLAAISGNLLPQIRSMRSSPRGQPFLPVHVIFSCGPHFKTSLGPFQRRFVENGWLASEEGVVESAKTMPPPTNAARIFQESCGLRDGMAAELASMHELAHRLKEHLDSHTSL